MKGITTALLTLAMATGVASAQVDNVFTVERSRSSAVDYRVSNYGIFGHDVAAGNGGFYYPLDSRKKYLYGSGLWFGAVKNINDTARPLVFLTYNPNSGASYATPGNAGSVPSDQHLYNSLDYNHGTGEYAGTGSKPAWPLWIYHDGDPAVQNPGIYEPDVTKRNRDGDYARPAFMPNVTEQFVARYHDGDLTRYEGFGSEFGFPLGLQIQQNVYSWQSGPYASAVVLQYEIVNISTDTLFDCVVGQVSDPDLGSAMNDRVDVVTGSDGKVRAGIVFTESESIGEYDALAQILLESPSTDANGFVRNGLRASMAQGHEIRTFRNWTIESDPQTPAERYHYLNGPAREGDDGAGDKRTILAGESFTMLPGDTAHFAMAFAIVEAPTGRVRGGSTGKLSNAGASAVPTLDNLTNALVGDFADGIFSTETTSSVESDAGLSSTMRLGPNPATTATMLEFTTGAASEVTVSVLNTMGERLFATPLGRREAGTHRASLDVSSLAAGSYLVVVDAGADRRTIKLSVAH